MNEGRTDMRIASCRVFVGNHRQALASDVRSDCQEGHPRVRNDGGRHKVPAEDRIPLGSPCRVLFRLSCSQGGQSTVEYALVLVAFLSIAIALAGVWHVSRSGRLLDRAVEASSHQLGGGDALGSWRDISLF